MSDSAFDAGFIEGEGLPNSFLAQVDRLWRPLSEHILVRQRSLDAMLVVGLCGPQGSGKSTGAMVLERLLATSGLRCARLSLDDLYLGKAERLQLAAKVHPLLATRGPPGTHDPALGVRVLEALALPGAVRLPRFDKARDDRTGMEGWPAVQGPVDVVILEGWCVGALPQPGAALAQPINWLETKEDFGGVWRRYVNEALAEQYPALFNRIGLLVLLRPPAFETVLGWRQEQERKLRAKPGGGGGVGVMSDAEVARFIQHYERLTRWIDAEMPGRADVVVQLDSNRAPSQVISIHAGV